MPLDPDVLARNRHECEPPETASLHTLWTCPACDRRWAVARVEVYPPTRRAHTVWIEQPRMPRLTPIDDVVLGRPR